MEKNNPVFDAPIPGQSLTAEPKSRPWQQPYQHSTVDDVIDMYMTGIGTKSFMKKVMPVIEKGVPVVTVVKGLLTAGTMEGKHSIDTGLLASPVLVEYIAYLADREGVNYTMFGEIEPEVDDDTAKFAVDKLRKKDNTEDIETSQEFFDNEESGVEVEQEEIEEQPKQNNGLMART